MRNALRSTGGWDPGAIRARLAQLFVPQGIGKKTSTRTPLEPKKAPSHPVHPVHFGKLSGYAGRQTGRGERQSHCWRGPL